MERSIDGLTLKDHVTNKELKQISSDGCKRADRHTVDDVDPWAKTSVYGVEDRGFEFRADISP